MGWGAPDWGTIPAYLQESLGELIEGPVCVVNKAEDGYVSAKMSPEWLELANTIYLKVESAEEKHSNFWYLADVFDEIDDQIWIDEAGHVTPEGNKLIAQEMMIKIQSQITDKFSVR